MIKDKKKDDKIMAQVPLNSSVWEKVKKLAEKRGVAAAALVRMWIYEHLEKESQ